MIRMLAACLAGAAASAWAGPVLVMVDMDSTRPGIQAVVDVPPGTTVVPDVAVYVFDPEGTRGVLSIGYIGALDRGIAFGHIPRPGLVGQVTMLSAKLGTPVNPMGSGSVFSAMENGFEGPEVQYFEAGGVELVPMQSAPLEPIFRVDIHLSGAAAGDVFEFAVMDFISVWRGGMGGAFTTRQTSPLDTGGDITPDGTLGLAGLDPDTPAPSPPAAFEVDFIDGGNRPARIRVGGCYANCDGSTTPPVLNVNDFVCFAAAMAAGDLYANCDGSTVQPMLSVNDFVCFQARFAAGCP